MKQLSEISRLLIALCLLGLSACGGGAASTATVDTAPIYTQLASTALALQTQTVLARPTATITPQASSTPEATNPPASTDTPLPGTTPSATLPALKTPKNTSQASCDNMEYVTDVTYPDGYVAAPGEYMIKTWTVKNLGPCTWNKDYVLVFGWGGVGTDWNEIGAVNLTKNVLPGETIDISVSLTAPKAKGDYGAYFVLQNDKGVNFPSAPLTIFITVQ
jgi:hypothetical protein